MTRVDGFESLWISRKPYISIVPCLKLMMPEAGESLMVDVVEELEEDEGGQ